jgi:hypothetical protein
MAIPSLDPDGFLPVGLHDCTFDQIALAFGSFQGSDRRPQLFARLCALVREATDVKFIRSILVDGSFATAKPDPNDIDLILVLSKAPDLAADLLPHEYTLISKRRVQKRYGFDMVAVREETVEFEEAVAFFERVRQQPGRRKGILRLSL